MTLDEARSIRINCGQDRGLMLGVVADVNIVDVYDLMGNRFASKIVKQAAAVICEGRECEIAAKRQIRSDREVDEILGRKRGRGRR